MLRVAPAFGLMAIALVFGIVPGCGSDGTEPDVTSRFFDSLDQALVAICECLPPEEEQQCLDELRDIGGVDQDCVRQVLEDHPEAVPAFECAAPIAEELLLCVQNAGCELGALQSCGDAFFEVDLDQECPFPPAAETALDACFDVGDTGDTGGAVSRLVDPTDARLRSGRVRRKDELHRFLELRLK